MCLWESVPDVWKWQGGQKWVWTVVTGIGKLPNMDAEK